jgi:hypothetical protein
VVYRLIVDVAMKAKHWFSVAFDMGDDVRAPWRQVTQGKSTGILLTGILLSFLLTLLLKVATFC